MKFHHKFNKILNLNERERKTKILSYFRLSHFTVCVPVLADGAGPPGRARSARSASVQGASETAPGPGATLEPTPSAAVGQDSAQDLCVVPSRPSGEHDGLSWNLWYSPRIRFSVRLGDPSCFIESHFSFRS